MEDQIKETRQVSNKLYKALQNDGYKGLPSEDEFYNALQDSTKASKLYQALEDNGYQGLPDRETFYGKVIEGYGQQQPSSTDTTSVGTPAVDQQKPETVVGSQQWRENIVNVPGDHSYNGKSYGEVYDQIIQEYGKNLTKQQGDPYAEARAQIMQAGITDDLRPEDADKLALDIRHGYANRYAGNASKEMVSALPDQVPNVDSLIDGLWYTRDMQNRVNHEAARLGLRKENYVNYYMKPQLAKALSDRYGYDVQSAKLIAGRLLSQDEHTNEVIRQNEAMNVVSQYAAPIIEGEFKKIQEAADKEAAPTMLNLNGTPEQKFLASVKNWQATDPETVWQNLKPMFDNMGSWTGIVGNEQLFNQISQMAEAEGIPVNAYIDKYVIPSYANAVQKEFERIAVEREMPKDTYEYIVKKMGESLIGNIGKWMLASEARRRAQGEAMQLTDTGQGEYKPGFGAKVAGGAAAMLPDMVMPFGGPFGLTAKVATMPLRGMTQTLITQGTRPLLARITQASLSGSASLGAFEGLKGAIEGGINPTGYEHLLAEDNRSAGDILLDVLKGGFERGIPSAVTGATMIGGPIGQKISNGRGFLANLAGWGTQVGVDAGLATAINIPKVVSGAISADDLKDEFFENIGTFAALGLHSKGKEFANLASGGRSINGVEFTKPEIESIEDRYLMPLRDVINKIDEAQSKRSLITKSRLGIDEAQEKRDAITEVGTEIFNDMLYSYGVPADLKVKVCTAFNLPVPENALKPKVLETTDKVVSDVVNEGFDNKVNLDYNKPGGVLDKLKKGESLSDYELTLRLLIQDNKRYNEIGEKLQAGNQLTEDEMAFVNQYNSRIDSIQAKMFSQELDRMASDFEKRNDLKKGTIKRMFADLKAGKGVEDAYMLDKFESELNEYSKILDEVKNARSQENVTESPIDEAIDIPTETSTGEAAVETPDTTAGAETVIEPATADEAPPQMDRSELADKLTNNGTNTIIEVMLNDGRKAYVIDGVLSNEYGRVTLADENGDVITMTDGNGYTIDRLPVNLLARDEAGNIIMNEQTVGEYLGGNAEDTAAKAPDVKDNLTTEQPAMSRIPVTDGVHQFEQAKPEDTLAALSESLDTPEELAETIDEQISDLTNELQQLTKAPKGKNKKVLTMDEKLQKKSAIKELQKRIDYWNSVKELQNSNEVKPEEPITEQPVTDGETITEPAVEPVAEPSAEISDQVEQPAAETTAEPVQPEKNAKQVVYETTVNNNVGKRYEITDKKGVRSEITIDGISEDGKVMITRQDIDKQGKPLGQPRQQSVSIDRMGKALIEGSMEPAKTTDDKLRIAFKNRPAMQNLISVLNETEAADLYSAYLDGDADRVSELFNELSETHKEDMVLQERGNRNSNVEKIMSGPGNREDKLRRVRDQYKGYPDAEVMLSDEAMQPTTLEEYIAEIHSRVPAKGEGPIAYNSYETADGHKIVGLQDETGYGTKSGADTKGFKPWLAPNGKGMSLAKYAEQIHSQLPEAVQEQYSDQDVRNALISVFGGAERPSDIPLMNIRRGIMQAEQAARLMEDMVIDGNISYQKVHQRFADRLEHAVMQTNENPSDGQKKAGNYKKGHLSFGGYHYTVENPAGSVRRGTDANGNPWEIEMNNTYGYILGKKGKDGDHLDMFINDKADLDNWDGTVYVVDQVDPKTGRFDEHKVMYGFGSEAEARDAYLSNYSRGWQGLGKITGVDKATFDKWLDSSDRKQKEFADHSIVKHKLESQVKNFDSALEKLDERGISIDDPELLKAYGLRNVILSRTGDHVSLTHFIANEPGQGSGTRFMEDLARLADEKGWTLALTPDTSFGARSMSALKRFYNRFGFKPNKGRYTDFETNESMVRRPKEWTPDAPEYQEQVLRDVIIDHLRDSGVEINTNWKEGQQILDRYNGEASLNKHKVYHGTGAEFDAFDHSHMGEGEGYQTFGYGTYVTEVPNIAKGYAEKGATKKYNRLNSGYGGKEIFYKGEKIDLQTINPHKMAYDMINNMGTVKKAIEKCDKFVDIAEDPEMKQMWRDTINILKNSKKSDFKARMADLEGQRYVYDVEIPDDNGENYLDYELKPTDKQVYNIVSQLYKLHMEDIVKEQRIATMIRNANSIGDIIDVLHQYIGGKATAKLLHDAGYVGTKYPTNYMAGGNREGTKNYVIYDENDAKITDTMQFFKTPDGQAYGYTYRGKIYIDPRIATAETPIHEFSHLWAQMKRETSPDEWNSIKQTLLGDKLVEPFIEKVKRDYPELAADGKEDSFVEEVLTQFSGKHGVEKLRKLAEEIKQELGGDAAAETIAQTAIRRVRSILNDFWKGVCNMMGWPYTNAEDVADAVLRDMLNGVDPMRARQQAGDISQQKVSQDHKKAQLDIINSTNPMTDDYHTGIRKVDDIKSFDEAYEEAKKASADGGWDELASYPDITNEMIEEARKTGKIAIYSSYPIKNGVFVTPSEMQAKDYSGGERIYSKQVPLNDVAWINLDEGQYAKVTKKSDAKQLDKEYADAVAAGDKEKVDALLREEAKRKGYSDDSSYQGSIAFNGAAPSKNGYFETRAERKQAFEDGNFEGTFSLGDYVEAGIDANDLEWQLYNPMRASAGHRASLESIHNINNAIRSKRGKIKMYRAVDANVKEDSFRNGDWVTPSREYAENHIELQDWKKGRIIEQEVSIDDIWWNGDDINEWGYDDGKKYAYKNTKNNRKLLEPTYDKDGNLIPLSKRFNSRKDDIMFQLVGEKGAAEADKAEGVKTRQESLKVAEELEKADKSSKAIKFATGWERGKDGKWRYETVDEKADILDDYNQKIVDYNKKRAEFHKEQGRLLELYDRLGAKIPKRLDSKKYSEEEQAKFREMRKEREKVWKQYMASNDQEKEFVNNARDGHTTKLVDLLGENHELFKYYPQLKDIAVRYAKNMQQGVAGSYNDKDGIKISIDQMHVFGDNKDLNNDNVNGILVHEIQHAIQDIEGFAKGGNLYTATSEAGINAIVQKKQAEQAAIANKIDMFNKWLNNPEELKLISQLDRRTVEEEKKHLEEQLDDLTYQYDRIGMYIDKIKHDKAPAMSDARDLYSRLAGEVEARNASERINMSEEDRRNTPIEKTEDYARDNQVVMMEYPEGGDEGLISFQKVDDTDELKKLEKEPTVKRYRAMQLIDGKLYPPMSAKVDGQMRQPTEIGVWEKAEERPDLVKNGKFVLNKAQKGQSNVPAAYNPYFHTSTSGLNDQFTSAYKRPELVVVEVEIPESELTSGYKAEGAKDAVGNVDWHSGVVNGQLPADRQRQVTLSRYSKVNRVVPDSEVADMIAKQLDGTDIAVPYNVVTPSLRAELEKKGVTISDKPAGSVTEDINGNPIRYQRVGEPESELTPEERQYWNKWDADMKKWKEQNALPANAEAPGPETPKQPDETMMDYVLRITKERKQRALWLTAPKLEDYQRMRTDKDMLESAREEEQKYPDSPAAKMRRIAAEFQQIRSAMSRQKAYDKSTVKAVTDFAQNYMRMGFGDNLSRGDVERMLSSVKNAVGAKTVKKEIDNIMNILTDNYLRNLEQQVVKLSSIRELRKNVQGVEVQGKLELKGQRMIQAFRSAMEYRLNEKEIREKLGEVAEKMGRNDEEAPMWEQEFEGLSIALQYQENIEASRKEWAELDRQYKEAVKEYKDSNRSYQAQQELLASIENAMMENKIERIGMYGDIIGRLQGNISESMKGAHEFIEREKERIKHIQQIANFDLAGKDMGAIRQPGKLSRIANSTAARFFLGPLATFEQMLKQFGSRSVNGEGYLYNHFMRKWMDATDNAFLNETKAKEELDEKAREVFGDEVKRWSDLYKLSNQPGMEVKVNDQGEDKTLTLTQGNMLYIYMANKMNDGKMKLRKMGITEEDVEAIKEALDPRLVQLGDWIQEDYLPKRRVEYNKVYERMFGAPMATIENYFPIKVLGDARYQEKDVNTMDQDPALPSTITGNIIKRTKNALPLDILNTDAVSLALEHIEDMERWAAQAEFNKDINTLLSYTTFRNKVKNMNTIYGSGDQLWNNFADTARMAAGTYRPKAKPGSVDKTISNIAKGVTAAKISFRMYTAFKQILSAPAFAHDVDLGNFIKNSVNPYGSWKWAMENMPVFQKRWKSRQVGDTRLMDDPTDWKMWKNNIVQMAARMGMSPNALVDGITCAVGARSIYESRLKKYTEMGLGEAEAEKRALQDAEIGYNLTQQSSEGAFVSAIQKDRTVAANMLSVFRNSSMAYTRQWVDAARNLSHMAQKGFKDDSIEFMTRQFQDQLGLDQEQAEEAAEKEYARAQRHELAKLLNMMFGVTVAWNLGAYLPYMLIGDDDDTKKEMMKDALLKGLAAGPTEGLAAGNIISELTGRALSEKTRKVFNEEGLGAAIDEAIKQSADYEINPLPLFADIQGMIKKGKYDKLAAAQDLFNIIAQSSVGVNPQTFTDIWNAAMDYGAPAWDGTNYSGPDADNLSRPKEFALFIMRLMNAPTSSWRNKYIDELDMSADDAKKLSYEEMARRYAHYKHWKDAPVMGWLRSDEERQEKMKSIRKQFKQAVAERMGRTVSDMNDEAVENLSDKMDSKDMIDILQKEINRRVEKSMEGMDDYQLEQEFDSSQRPFKRKLIAKNLSKRTGASSDPYGDKPSADYEQLYQELRTGADVTEDAELLNMQENARDRGDEKRKDEISKKRSKLRNKYIKGEKGAYGLKPGDDKHNKEVMEEYRKARRELYDSLRR